MENTALLGCGTEVVRVSVSVPKGPDPRAPNAPPGAGAAFSDTVLAPRPGRSSRGAGAASAAAAPAGAAVPPVSPGVGLRGLPLGVQGMWVGLVCIVLLIGSAAALRSMVGGKVGAGPVVSASASAVAATATVAGSGSAIGPSVAPLLPTSTATAITIGGPGSGPGGAFGALAIRDRLASDVRLHKIGPFLDDLDRLIEIEPAAIDRADVRKMIADAAVIATAPSAKAEAPESDRIFTFLTTKAGAAGPDILFDLVTSRGGTRASARAEELLRLPAVVERGTPAFRIANELRVAETCKDRTKLYERVKADGDRRVLQFLFQMARCGKGPTDCCQGNEPAYRDAVRAINAKK